MASRDGHREIRERGALIVRRHLGGLVDPSRLVLIRIEAYEGSRTPRWFLCLDGDEDNRVCYVAYGTGGNLVTFRVEGKGSDRHYDTFGEAERDDEFKAELLGRVKGLIGEGGKD